MAVAAMGSAPGVASAARRWMLGTSPFLTSGTKVLWRLRRSRMGTGWSACTELCPRAFAARFSGVAAGSNEAEAAPARLASPAFFGSMPAACPGSQSSLQARLLTSMPGLIQARGSSSLTAHPPWLQKWSRAVQRGAGFHSSPIRRRRPGSVCRLSGGRPRLLPLTLCAHRRVRAAAPCRRWHSRCARLRAGAA